jgi:hypothetical protein
MKALPIHPGLPKTLYTFNLSALICATRFCLSAFRRDPGETYTPTTALLALPFDVRAGPKDRRTVSVGLIILIIVLLLLLGGGGFYVYRSGWWGSARGNPNAGPVGNPLAIISVVVLLIVFVVCLLGFSGLNLHLH